MNLTSHALAATPLRGRSVQLLAVLGLDPFQVTQQVVQSEGLSRPLPAHVSREPFIFYHVPC